MRLTLSRFYRKTVTRGEQWMKYASHIHDICALEVIRTQDPSVREA